MPETNHNIWAPWRLEYIRSLDESGKESGKESGEKSGSGCFLCDYWQDPSGDREHHVLWRTDTTLVLLNRFPYTGGHLLLAPSLHKGQLDELPEQHLQDLTTLTRDATILLKEVVKAHGFRYAHEVSGQL